MFRVGKLLIGQRLPSVAAAPAMSSARQLMTHLRHWVGHQPTVALMATNPTLTRQSATPEAAAEPV